MDYCFQCLFMCGNECLCVGVGVCLIYFATASLCVFVCAFTCVGVCVYVCMYLILDNFLACFSCLLILLAYSQHDIILPHC